MAKKIVGEGGKIIYKASPLAGLGRIGRFLGSGNKKDRRYYYADGTPKKVPTTYATVSTSNVICENCGKDISYKQAIELEKYERDPKCPKCGSSLHPGLATARTKEAFYGCGLTVLIVIAMIVFFSLSK